MIRCLIVDDEPLALELLSCYIDKNPELSLVDTCLSTRKAREIMESTPVDLLLLDINMPDCSGIDFVKSLPEHHPYVVFTTAYPEYALDSYKLHAVDYLMKPISYESFNESVERVKKLLVADSISQKDKFIYVKSDGKNWKISLDDIAFVSGMGEYVKIQLKGQQRRLITLSSMKGMEDLLPPEMFMRILKSHIINLNQIEAHDSSSVVICGETLPVSMTYKSALHDWIKSHRQ